MWFIEGRENTRDVKAGEGTTGEAGRFIKMGNKKDPCGRGNRVAHMDNTCNKTHDFV